MIFQDTMDKFAKGKPWIRSATPLYDVFEPTFVQHGLELEDNLRHLVFDMERWQSMGGSVSNAQDALSKHFQKHS